MVDNNTLDSAIGFYWVTSASRTINAACLTAGDTTRSVSDRNSMLREMVSDAFRGGVAWALETQQKGGDTQTLLQMIIDMYWRVLTDALEGNQYHG